MLSLDKVTAKLTNISFFDEKHGEESVKGIALRFTFDAANSILDEFSPGLKKSLYRAPDPTDAAQLFEEPEYLPLRRFPLLDALRWELAMIGREVIIDYGIGDDSAIRFIEATADKWTFDLREGGSVGVTFRVKAHPDADQVAHLFTLKGNEVSIAIAIGSGQQHSLESDGDDDGDHDDDDAPADLVEALAPAKPKRGRKAKVFADALDGSSDDPFGKTEAETVSVEDWPFPDVRNADGELQP